MKADVILGQFNSADLHVDYFQMEGAGSFKGRLLSKTKGTFFYFFFFLLIHANVFTTQSRPTELFSPPSGSVHEQLLLCRA